MAGETFPFPSPFEPGPYFVTGPNNYKQQESSEYFATSEVADWLAERYGGSVTLGDLLTTGVYSIVDQARKPVKTRFVIITGTSGRVMQKNAGLWANLFMRYPQAFDYVDSLINSEIQAAIQGPAV